MCKLKQPQQKCNNPVYEEVQLVYILVKLTILSNPVYEEVQLVCILAKLTILSNQIREEP